MDTRTLAIILLVGHTLSAVFIFFVLKRQLSLFKLYIDPDLRAFRLVLFFLSVAILVGNIIPITVDILVLFNEVQRAAPTGAGLYYSISNVITAVLSAALIWTMYRLAAKTATLVEQDKETALKISQ